MFAEERELGLLAMRYAGLTTEIRPSISVEALRAYTVELGGSSRAMERQAVPAVCRVRF